MVAVCLVRGMTVGLVLVLGGGRVLALMVLLLVVFVSGVLV